MSLKVISGSIDKPTKHVKKLVKRDLSFIDEHFASLRNAEEGEDKGKDKDPKHKKDVPAWLSSD